MSFSRIGGLAAIGFAALILGTNLVLAPAGLPLLGDPIGEVTEFFDTDSDLVRGTSALTPLVWILATLFGASVVAALWPAERARGEAWSLVGFAGLIMQNIMFAGVTATRLALTSTTGDRSASVGIWAMNGGFFVLNGTFLALAMIGLSVGGVRGGLIRPWHAALGFTAAALQFSSAVFLPVAFDDPGAVNLLGLSGWLLWVVWLVGYGVTLIRRSHSVSPQPSTSLA